MTTYQLIGLLFTVVGLATGISLFLEGGKKKSYQLDLLPATNTLVWISRILIGVLFTYSGFVKANDYIGFAYKLEEYFMVFGEHFSFMKGFWDLFIPLAEPLAWFISVFEIALAFAIVVGWKMNLTMWLTLLMMVFFTILTGYSAVTGAVTDCGCFGDALKLLPFESFMKDIILMIMVTPLFIVRKQIKPFPGASFANIVVGVVFLISGVYSYWCHEHLPLVDYRAYKEGTDLKVCTTEEGSDGIIKCKDWYPYFPEEEVNLFEGNTLMIIFYDAAKAPEDAMKMTTSLYEPLNKNGVKVVGATSTGPSKMSSYIEKYGLPYPMSYLDETVLKTVIRSHPGYMLLKEGVVVKKWHYNDAPSDSEVMALLQ